MNLPRCGGLLLHPTSLPSRFGIGDFGEEAYRFAKQLSDCGLTVWQMLPLGPTGVGNSPYSSYSAFAGNPLLLSLELLEADHLLERGDQENAPRFPLGEVDYNRVSEWKLPLLLKAQRRFKEYASAERKRGLEQFCERHAEWLDDYALFMALKNHFGFERSWTSWEPGLVQREPETLQAWRKRLAQDIECQQIWQFEFFRQFQLLRDYCASNGLSIMGDIPIYVAHDSADVWAHPDQFQLDEKGMPAVVSGVPPDYFSETGQLWGNPIYRWDEMAPEYEWWCARFRGAFHLFDILRLDHFRGFEGYWEVPATEKTAVNGRWAKGPGAALFRAVKRKLGEVSIVAENLGVITSEVEAIRHEFQFPGMAVLQFAFGTDPQASDFRPHNMERNVFAYTGTHDNDTVLGWWNSGGGDSTRSAEDIEAEKEFAKRYVGYDGPEMNWALARLVFASVARAAVMPMQDVLGLGSESRMNKPGQAAENWKWRMLPGAFTPELQARLKDLAITFGRAGLTR